MAKRLASLGVTAVVALLLLPAGAHAEGVDCIQPTVVAPDSRIIQGTIPANGVFFFTWGVTLGRSYSVEARFPFVPFNTVTLAMSVGNPADCAQTATATVLDTRQTDPQLGYVGVPANSSARVSALVTATPGSNTLLFAKVTNNTASPQTYTFSVSDTTLFGPAWSTISNFNTYYSFSNTTNSSITGTLTLTTTTGTSGGTTTFTIAPNGAKFTNTVALSTPRMVTGNATFAHNGPPGAVLVESDVADFTITPAYIQPVKFQAVRDNR